MAEGMQETFRGLGDIVEGIQDDIGKTHRC